MDLLVVGNGLSIDLYQTHRETLTGWDPSSPLSWNINYPTNSDTSLLRSLTHLGAAIDLAKVKSPNGNDFELINEAIVQAELIELANFSESDILRTEIYCFLSFAYSSFDKLVRSLNTNNWKWQQFLEVNKRNIIGAISFNYDLVLERTLRKIGLKICAYGMLPEERQGIFVGKPHGSIDYEVVGIDTDSQIPPIHVILQNDTSLRRLSDAELLLPRIQCELVPPLESSVIRNFQWVAPIFEWTKTRSSQISRCIIIGHSYSDPDKAEINELLDSLIPRTKVVIANPGKSEELVVAIKSRNLEIEHWKDGPPILSKE